MLVIAIALSLVACDAQQKSVDPEDSMVQYREALTAAILTDENYFSSIAKAVQNRSEGEHAYYYYQTGKTNFPADIQQRVASLPIDYGLDLSCIYTDPTAEIYPEGSCVFQCTVMSEIGVYCWVNLVYNENWESVLQETAYMEMQEQNVLFRIDSNWCVVLLYGY